jgi:hypothetical protein
MRCQVLTELFLICHNMDMQKFVAVALFAVLAGASFAQCEKCADHGKKSAPKSEVKMSKQEAEFLKTAQKMAIEAEGKKACCKTTATKAVVKGEGDCCNNPKAKAKFKVFVANQGYKYFGCADSAAEGRKQLLASGLKVGKVQKVTSKKTIAG